MPPDAVKLKYALTKLLGVEEADDDYKKSDIVLALQHAGVLGFEADFLGLATEDLLSLTMPGENDGDDRQPLPVVKCRKLQCLLYFFHHSSRAAGGAINIESATKTQYDMYRVSEFASTQDLVPWNVAKPADGDDALLRWNKNVKLPSKSDFRVFKDVETWLMQKDHTSATLESVSLTHLIDSNHRVTNPDLDEAQRKWLYNIFKDVMLNPEAKSIVRNHKEKKNTRDLWAELCGAFDECVTTSRRVQRISTYLTSTRLADINWNGTQESFIQHHREQARIHNELCKKDNAYNDDQLCGFLETCISGIENLAGVKRMHELAAKSAGKPLSWKFSEYTQELINAAQVFDGGNTHTTNPRVKRSVNKTELIFDDGIDFVDCNSEYETNIHDVDTPIEELMVAQARSTPFRGRRRKVSLNKDTWYKLSEADQTAWDQLSEEGKALIIGYVGQRRIPATNARPDTTPFQRQTNTHELAAPTEEQHQGPTHFQVSNHEQQSGPSLLHMATTKTLPSPGMDINLHLSQKTKPKLSTDVSKPTTPVEVTQHELYEREYTSYTHEVIVRNETGEPSPHKLISFGEEHTTPFTFMLGSTPVGHDPLEPSTSAAGILDYSGLQLIQQPKVDPPTGFTLMDFSDSDPLKGNLQPSTFDKGNLQPPKFENAQTTSHDFFSNKNLEGPQPDSISLTTDDSPCGVFDNGFAKPQPLKHRILPKSDGSGHYFQPLTPSCSQGSNSNSSTTDYDLITFEDTSVPPKRALLDGPKSQYLPAPTLDHSTAGPQLDLLSIPSVIHDADDGFQRPKHFKKQSPSGLCSFLSPAAYQHQSSSSLSSRSSHSQSAKHSNRYAALAPDFWEAKSD